MHVPTSLDTDDVERITCWS